MREAFANRAFRWAKTACRNRKSIDNNPDLILADEPTGNVDQETAGEIMDIFVQMHQLKKTVVIVTHDMDVAMKCENVIKLSDGMICES